MAATPNRFGRRTFLGILGFGGVGAIIRPGSVAAAGRPGGARPTRNEARPGFRLDPARASSVVGASHSNMERVRALVLEQPALAKASWDWGFGDWETALGAASHTGRREIALFLIAHGARPTLFSAAMLGQVDTVRAFVDANPELVDLDGPHGIPLLNHARAGRAEAERVVDYLMDRGARDEPMGVPAEPALEERYGGRYEAADGPEIGLTVRATDRWLMIGAGPTPSSRVLPVSDDVFHPTGAPAVRLHFQVEDGRTARIVVVDGPDRWELNRV